MNAPSVLNQTFAGIFPDCGLVSGTEIPADMLPRAILALLARVIHGRSDSVYTADLPLCAGR
jgi:hypothetical protein